MKVTGDSHTLTSARPHGPTRFHIPPFFPALTPSLLLLSWHPSPRGDLHPRAQAAERLAVPPLVCRRRCRRLLLFLLRVSLSHSPAPIHTPLHQHPAKHLAGAASRPAERRLANMRSICSLLGSSCRVSHFIWMQTRCWRSKGRGEEREGRREKKSKAVTKSSLGVTAEASRLLNGMRKSIRPLS